MPISKKTLFLLANILLFFYLAGRGYVIYSDTCEYVGHFIYRSPAYPIFLDSVRFFSGTNYLFVTALLQTALIQCAAAFFAATLVEAFDLGTYSFLIFDAALLLPLFDVFAKIGGVGAAIISEGLSFSLFLLALALGVRAIVNRDLRAALWFSFIAATGSLLRSQLAFLQPAAILLAFLVLRGGKIRAALLLALLFVAGLFAGDRLERFYNLEVNNYYGRLSVAPLHVAGKLFYFSTKDDFRGLPAADSITALKIYETLDSKKLLAKYNVRPVEVLRDSPSFNDICWGSLSRVYKEYRCRTCGETPYFFALHSFSGRIAGWLAARHWREYVAVSLSGMVHSGDFLTAAFIACFVLAFSQGAQAGLAGFFIFSGLILLANCFAVEFMSASLPRLYFYSSELELVCVLLVAAILTAECRKNP